MSARVDKFCENLRERLNAVEARAESVKASIQSLPGKTEKAVQDNVNDVRARLRAQQERINKCRTDLRTWGEQKEAETEAMIREWKAKREAQKLTTRADRAEAYAEAAVTVALATIEEAEVAMLDAALARMDADSAQK